VSSWRICDEACAVTAGQAHDDERLADAERRHDQPLARVQPALPRLLLRVRRDAVGTRPREPGGAARRPRERVARAGRVALGFGDRDQRIPGRRHDEKLTQVRERGSAGAAAATAPA